MLTKRKIKDVNKNTRKYTKRKRKEKKRSDLVAKYCRSALLSPPPPTFKPKKKRELKLSGKKKVGVSKN